MPFPSLSIAHTWPIFGVTLNSCLSAPWSISGLGVTTKLRSSVRAGWRRKDRKIEWVIDYYRRRAVVWHSVFGPVSRPSSVPWSRACCTGRCARVGNAAAGNSRRHRVLRQHTGLTKVIIRRHRPSLPYNPFGTDRQHCKNTSGVIR